MVKPGTELYRFLSRKRGHAVRITLSDPGRAGTLDHRTVSCGASAPAVTLSLANLSSLSITSPTMLLGVEAPAVRPTTTGA